MADGAGSGAVSLCVAAGSSDAGNTRARAVCDSTDAHRAAVDRNTARNPSDPWRPRGLSERSLPTHHSCPVHEGTIVRGPPRSHCSTGLLNLKSSHITRYGTTSRRSAGRRVFFCDDLLQRRILQRQVDIHPFEAVVLVFEFFQPLNV